jgi:hypothetical protein
MNIWSCSWAFDGNWCSDGEIWRYEYVYELPLIEIAIESQFMRSKLYLLSEACLSLWARNHMYGKYGLWSKKWSSVIEIHWKDFFWDNERRNFRWAGICSQNDFKFRMVRIVEAHRWIRKWTNTHIHKRTHLERDDLPCLPLHFGQP